jgi:methylphosphotriester-DNA--protein-cysteine methyltransferase
MKRYRLINAQGEEYESAVAGTLGGHRRLKIYGRLDCPNALHWLALGHYAQHRVFFADEDTALAAGYRPCARCLRERHRAWQQAQEDASED